MRSNQQQLYMLLFLGSIVWYFPNVVMPYSWNGNHVPGGKYRLSTAQCMANISCTLTQGSYWPAEPGKLLEFCQPGKLLEFYVRTGIFCMRSQFMQLVRRRLCPGPAGGLCSAIFHYLLSTASTL